MKAIRAIYENGQIKPLEPVPEIESAQVLVIFPDPSEPSKQQSAPDSDWEARLFGAGKDFWTDEVEAAVRESFLPRRPDYQIPTGEDSDAPA